MPTEEIVFPVIDDGLEEDLATARPPAQQRLNICQDPDGLT